jgi:hypothetical protein
LGQKQFAHHSPDLLPGRGLFAKHVVQLRFAELAGGAAGIERLVAWEARSPQINTTAKEQLTMQRLKTLGIAFLALLALGSIASATAASAETLQLLPEATGASPIKFKVKSGAGELQIKGKAETIKCASDTGTGEATSKRLGKFDVLFEKCLASTGFGLSLCTGLVDKTESSILVKGTYHLRRLSKAEPKHIMVSFLIEPVHFTCVVGVFSALFIVKGCALGLITPINTLTKTYKIALNQTGGANEFTEVLNDAETATEKCILETSENGGGFVQSGEKTLEELEGAEQGGKAIETLLMA